MADSTAPPPQDPSYPVKDAYPPPQAYPQAAPPQQQYPQQQPYPPQQPYPQQPPGYPEAQPPAYPQQAYPQGPPPAQATTVVVTQPVTVQAPIFRDRPITVTDSNGQQVQTILEYRSGALTWLICALVCLFTLEIGCCCFGLIPFCINATKDVYHITPTDGKTVGIYKRL